MEQTGNDTPGDEGLAVDDERPPRPGDVTKEDLAAVPFEDAISDLGVVECHDLATRFRARLSDATESKNEQERRVYFALSSICDLHFKPEERGEAYGPMMVLSDGSRTASPKITPAHKAKLSWRFCRD